MWLFFLFINIFCVVLPNLCTAIISILTCKSTTIFKLNQIFQWITNGNETIYIFCQRHYFPRKTNDDVLFFPHYTFPTISVSVGLPIITYLSCSLSYQTTPASSFPGALMVRNSWTISYILNLLPLVERMQWCHRNSCVWMKL